MQSLVSITHPRNPSELVPFINGNAPLTKVCVETRFVEPISAMGFDVEVHEEPYDPVAANNAAAMKLAQALVGSVVVEEAQVQSVVAEAEPTPEPVAEAPVAEAPAEETATVGELAATEASTEGAASEEGSEMSAEDLAALRKAIVALTSVKKAKELMKAYGIELDAGITALEDIKAALIVMIDG